MRKLILVCAMVLFASGQCCLFPQGNTSDKGEVVLQDAPYVHFQGTLLFRSDIALIMFMCQDDIDCIKLHLGLFFPEIAHEILGLTDDDVMRIISMSILAGKFYHDLQQGPNEEGRLLNDNLQNIKNNSGIKMMQGEHSSGLNKIGKLPEVKADQVAAPAAAGVAIVIREAGKRVFKYFAKKFFKPKPKVIKPKVKNPKPKKPNLPFKKIEIDPKQAQRKFSHAKDFGVEGNYNPVNLGKFIKSIERHVRDPASRAIQGTYRGEPVVFYANIKTGLTVITSRVGQFISGWKLNEKQLKFLLEIGKIGGG